MVVLFKALVLLSSLFFSFGYAEPGSDSNESGKRPSRSLTGGFSVGGGFSFQNDAGRSVGGRSFGGHYSGGFGGHSSGRFGWGSSPGGLNSGPGGVGWGNSDAGGSDFVSNEGANFGSGGSDFGSNSGSGNSNTDGSNSGATKVVSGGSNSGSGNSNRGGSDSGSNKVVSGGSNSGTDNSNTGESNSRSDKVASGGSNHGSGNSNTGKSNSGSDKIVSGGSKSGSGNSNTDGSDSGSNKVVSNGSNSGSDNSKTGKSNSGSNSGSSNSKAGGSDSRSRKEMPGGSSSKSESRSSNSNGTVSVPSGDLKSCSDFETEFLGQWTLHSKNAGVSAMQLQLMPNDKAIWFDTTNLGRSAIQLKPLENCPINAQSKKPDCWAHAIEYNTKNGHIKTLRMPSDVWCSSGGLSSKGNLISTGGAQEGIKSVRIVSTCKKCDFSENRAALSADRWYSSNQVLEDGSFAVVGGRHSHSYDIFPPDMLQFPQKKIDLPFLQETEDPVENNLYPFLYLLPDGNLFIFANDKGIVIVPKTGEIVRKLPVLPGGARNYPASGMSVLLPLTLSSGMDPKSVDAHVLICGGNTKQAFALADKEPRQFLPALKDCGKINVMQKNPTWEFDMMPSPRVMGDMFLLPNGQLLLISGAKVGTSGWFNADEPNLTPALYHPNKPIGQRFKELAPTNIPRMYHSSGTVLIDGKVLITGSNPNPTYDTKSKYPVELRVEKFSPPYLDPKLHKQRPVIKRKASQTKLKYGKEFKVAIELNVNPGPMDINVTMLSPPFTTHGFCQNHRLLILKPISVSNKLLTVRAPLSGKLAPPGYYMLFVVHCSVPSKGIWVTIQ